MARAFASLDPEGQAQLKAELVALWKSYNRAEGRGTLVDAEYLEVIAFRGEKTTDISAARSTLRDRKPQSRRAEMLADRIEEGAARLADFASRLTEKEWSTPVTEGGKSGRSIGVIVNHVASVYPIEVDLARAIANGKSVIDVTWEVVSKLNAGHAAEHANVSKAETLALLKSNSQKAAEVVREFTDDELDRAAPFSLSFGAPVTAQFVLEDHAVRHSWHHLARIRKTVGNPGTNPAPELG